MARWSYSLASIGPTSQGLAAQPDEAFRFGAGDAAHRAGIAAAVVPPRVLRAACDRPQRPLEEAFVSIVGATAPRAWIDLVAASAAATRQHAGAVADMADGFAAAREVLGSGTAMAKLRRLQAFAAADPSVRSGANDGAGLT